MTAEYDLRLHRDRCTASGDGPATATMSFAGGQDLLVELDDSWTNLLGPCGDDFGAFGD